MLVNVVLNLAVLHIPSTMLRMHAFCTKLGGIFYLNPAAAHISSIRTYQVSLEIYWDRYLYNDQNTIIVSFRNRILLFIWRIWASQGHRLFQPKRTNNWQLVHCFIVLCSSWGLRRIFWQSRDGHNVCTMFSTSEKIERFYHKRNHIVHQIWWVKWKL